MVDLATLRGMKLAELGERKPHEPGWYKGRFIAATPRDVAKRDGGTFVSYALAFTAENPLNEQDMRGVNTSRRVYKEVLVFDKEAVDLAEWIKKMNPDYAPSRQKENGAEVTLDEALDSLVNIDVQVEVAEDAKWRRDRGEYRPAVINVRLEA